MVVIERLTAAQIQLRSFHIGRKTPPAPWDCRCNCGRADPIRLDKQAGGLRNRRGGDCGTARNREGDRTVDGTRDGGSCCGGLPDLEIRNAGKCH